MSAPAAMLSLRDLRLDERRGSLAMAWFITTEATLFVVLFFTYFYLGKDNPYWPTDPPPKLLLASIMLTVLLVSSAVVYASERLAKAGRIAAARATLLLTIVLGLGFVTLQVFEYRDHLRSLKPTTDAYGSIFYTITTFHGAHLLLGLSLLSYVLFLPDLEGKSKPPHKPLHNAGLYWHFVDAVWVIVVCLLYYLPHLHRGGFVP